MKNEQNQEASAEKPSQINLEQFHGPDSASLKKLTFGLWLIEHRRWFKRVGYGLLIITGAISWTYTIYGFAEYIFRGMSEEELLQRQLVESQTIGHDFLLQQSAQNLIFGPVQFFGLTERRYDLVAQVRNPNEKWRAEFDYYFLVAGQTTAKKAGYIFPGETKYLIALAQELTARPANPQLIIENLRWQRINQHQYPNWSEYYNNHLNFEIKEVKFVPAAANELSGKIGLNQLNFHVTNKTPYNYWQVDFIILLYRASNLVNVNQYSLTDFMSGESRQVQTNWPGSIGRVDRVEILPELNFLDKNIYFKFEGGVGEEK